MADSETLVQVVFALPLDQEFTYKLPPGADWKDDFIGCRVQAPFHNRQKVGVILGTASSEEHREKAKTLVKIIDSTSLFGPHTLETARWLARHYLCSLGEALEAMLPSARRERELPEAGYEVGVADHAVELSDEQRLAVETIVRGPGQRYYLKGMTGSGKTEVFLQTAHRVLEQGQSVVYLVPEIALTWQLLTTLKARFGSLVAVLHSRLTPSQRLKEWHRIQSGTARFVVGARSAVFAPAASVGLYIVDEEHEGGYKSSHTPRYHARQVSLWLAARKEATLVMGSATPSLEAVQAMDEGTFTSLALSRRLAGGAPPHIRIVSLKGNESLLSPALVEALHKTLEDGRQSVLFLNRRGFTHHFHCQSCGYEAKCRQCSVSLTWHKNRNVLLCHYCGFQMPPTSLCPSCGSLDVGWSTPGTEQIEELTQRLFPRARIARLDSDTAEKKGFAEQVLKSFREYQLDVLIGTQMVAKGLNFPGLRLVGILNADLGLAMPDFRAKERVFNLIRQVSGRAGRFLPDGEVILQTLRPDDETIRYAAEGQDLAFWRSELDTRRLLGFPPFSRLIRVVVRGRSLETVVQEVQTLSAELRSVLPEAETGVELLGPVECALSLVAGNHRWQILLRASTFPLMHHGLSRVHKGRAATRGTYREIDVDPLSML